MQPFRKYVFDLALMEDDCEYIRSISQKELDNMRRYEYVKNLIKNVRITVWDNGIMELRYERQKYIMVENTSKVLTIISEFKLDKKDLEGIKNRSLSDVFDIKIDIKWTNVWQVPFKHVFKYLFKGYNIKHDIFVGPYGQPVCLFLNDRIRYNKLVKDWAIIDD